MNRQVAAYGAYAPFADMPSIVNPITDALQGLAQQLSTFRRSSALKPDATRLKSATATTSTDLNSLPGHDATAFSTWIQTFTADGRRMTIAGNALRRDLGLGPAASDGTSCTLL